MQAVDGGRPQRVPELCFNMNTFSRVFFFPRHRGQAPSSCSRKMCGRIWDAFKSVAFGPFCKNTTHAHTHTFVVAFCRRTWNRNAVQLQKGCLGRRRTCRTCSGATAGWTGLGAGHWLVTIEVDFAQVQALSTSFSQRGFRGAHLGSPEPPNVGAV